MMYANKFVACVKSGGKVLREYGDTVHLPFASEYAILLKNLSSTRAKATITIDGTDVLNGSSLVVDANSSLEIERFLKDLDKGNKFKFIERTKAVEDHRGIKVDDGVIRIQYQFEVPRVLYRKGPSGSDLWGDSRRLGGGYAGDYGMYGLSSSVSCNSVKSYPVNSTSTEVYDAGITVPGAISDQKFHTVQDFAVEDQKHVIVLRLVGETSDNKKVVQPVTIKHKPVCITCGKLNKASNKFCSECGTALEII